jgi:hypothetical protein
MIRARALTQRTVAERFREIKDEEDVWGDISAQTRALAQRVIESSLEEALSARCWPPVSSAQGCAAAIATAATGAIC